MERGEGGKVGVSPINGRKQQKNEMLFKGKVDNTQWTEDDAQRTQGEHIALM